MRTTAANTIILVLSTMICVKLGLLFWVKQDLLSSEMFSNGEFSRLPYLALNDILRTDLRIRPSACLGHPRSLARFDASGR
jgi:hypothetical protein